MRKGQSWEKNYEKEDHKQEGKIKMEMEMNKRKKIWSS